VRKVIQINFEYQSIQRVARIFTVHKTIILQKNKFPSKILQLPPKNLPQTHPQNKFRKPPNPPTKTKKPNDISKTNH